MARPGYIHDKLDMKLLLLYLAARLAAPVEEHTLMELSLCDNGVDYFVFIEALTQLVETDHLAVLDGRYAITEKGRKNGGICESGLPYSVRLRCDKNLAALNADLRRAAQVRTQIAPRADGTVTLRLILDDERANLMTLDLLTVSQNQAETLAAAFRARPEQIYNAITGILQEQG